MLDRNKFFSYLLDLKMELDRLPKDENVFVFINRELYGDSVLVVDVYDNITIVDVFITEEYACHEKLYIRVLREILNGAFDPGNYSDMAEHITYHKHTGSAQANGNFYQASQWGITTGNYSLRPKTITNLHASNLMDEVERVFGPEQGDVSRKVRDRRHNNLYVEYNAARGADGLSGTNQKPDEISIYLDTSGSIGHIEAAMAEAIMAQFSNRYPNTKINCYNFSTEVHDLKDFSWSNVRSVIGGGTTLQCVLDHMEENPCRINVVISDMYFSEIDYDELENPVPEDIVWISVANNPDTELMFKCMKAKRELCFVPPTE